MARLRLPLVTALIASAVAPATPYAGAQPIDAADQAFVDAHATGVAGNPIGLALQIRTETGATTFATGELITLSLEFSDREGTRYAFDSRTYDRSGRLGIDRLHIAPNALVEDPLHDYYRALGFGFIGGGISSLPAPLTAPRVVTLDVNECVRFASPGRYQLYVESHRFTDQQATSFRTSGVTVTSNILTLTIQSGSLDAASVEELPARVLRYTETPAAAAELARRLLSLSASESASRVGTDAFHVRYGLYGTPHRLVALETLKNGLATARGLVNETVPRAAAFLDVMLAYPTTGTARRNAPTGVSDNVVERMRAYQCRLLDYQQLALAAGLRGSSQDAVRAAATFATTERPPGCAARTSPDAARVLAEHFDQLDARQQEAMLTWRWGIVAGARMAPALRALVSGDSLASDNVRDLALVRLGELEPDEAERLSREDVTSGHLRFGARALRIPAENEDAFGAQVSPLLTTWLTGRPPSSRTHDLRRADRHGILRLLARFGTAGDVDAVVAHLTPIPDACAIRTTLAAYVLRVDPERGERLLRDLLDTTVSHCATSVIDELARAWPHLLPASIMIATLDHADARVAASAARALARIGDEHARDALWARLRAWHATWQMNAYGVRIVAPRIDDPATDGRALEQALQAALISGVRWRATAQDRQALRALCISDMCREELSIVERREEHTPVDVSADDTTGETLYVLAGLARLPLDDLVLSLASYPPGTRVFWRAGGSHSETRGRELYEHLRDAAARRGIHVLPHAPPTP